MAYIQAYGPRGNPIITCRGVESAKRLASELMRDSPDFRKVKIFDDDGNYVTTAWGE